MTEDVAKETTNEEVEAKIKEVFPDYDENFPSLDSGITYKGKFYEFDEE